LIEDLLDTDFLQMIKTEQQKLKDKVLSVGEFIVNHNFLIHPTVSTENFQTSYYLFNQFTNVWFLLGSHPEIVNKNFDLQSYLKNQKRVLNSSNFKRNLLIGIGEVGLDYFYTQDKQIITLQKNLFRSQIKLALDLNMPLIIHCRDAFQDLYEILADYPEINGRFLIHCFTGSKEDVLNIRSLGGYFGIGGIVTFSSAKDLQEAVSIMKLSEIFLETDLPFLSPAPMRSKTCLPEYISFTCAKVADIFGVSTDKVWLQTAHSAQKFFKLD
jgi:TatD DNase family protein